MGADPPLLSMGAEQVLPPVIGQDTQEEACASGVVDLWDAFIHSITPGFTSCPPHSGHWGSETEHKKQKSLFSWSLSFSFSQKRDEKQ